MAKAALVLLLGSIIVVLASPGAAAASRDWLATSVALLAVAAGLLGGISNVLVLVA